jgi:alpha-L-fucosidase
MLKNRFYKILYIFVIFCLLNNFIFPQDAKNIATIKKGESIDQIIRKAANVVPSKYQYEWQKMEYICFIHFGINTFTGREWGEGKEDPKIFNPVNLDARQWVKVIKDAGMKMMIITAKHHDGFCLWPTKMTDHSVKKSPWKNGQGDIVADVAKACKEFGVKFGIYLSPWDRHEITYGEGEKYDDFFIAQLTELLSNYGEISEVWFDGACGEGANGKKQSYDFKRYYQVIRKLQPTAMISIMGPDTRWVGTESGYGRETEWSVVPNITQDVDFIAEYSQKNPVDGAFIPGNLMELDLGSREKIKNAKSLVWYPAEIDVSIRPGWFYHEAQDNLVKSPEKLLDIYFSSVGRNGVLLLNIPPDKNGLINKNDVSSLMGMKKILDATFSTNFLSGSKVNPSNEKKDHPAQMILDGKKNNYWTTKEGVESAVIEFEMKNKKSFNCAMLMEQILVGQRIESFKFEAWINGQWQEFTKGTTIGYKRLLRFPSISTGKVRLTIDKSRMSPTLKSVGLFKLPEQVNFQPEGCGFEENININLSTDVKDAEIFYTLDGTDPSEKSIKYTGQISLNKTTQLKAIALENGKICGLKTTSEYIKCKKVKSVKIENEFSAKYSPFGANTIINSKRGSLDFTDNQWLGFEGTDASVILDLGEEKHLQKISAGFFQQQGSWIFLPEKVLFSLSGDGNVWKNLNEIKTITEKNESVFVKDFSIQVESGKARFIKMYAKNIGICPDWHDGKGSKAWIFLDEIIIE